MPNNPHKQYFVKYFLIIFLPTICLAGALLLFAFTKEKNHHITISATEAVSFLKAEQELVSDIIHSITTDLLTLAGSHEVTMTIKNNTVRNDLLHDLLLFSQQKRIYDQIRYLDETGQEIIRINFNNGESAIVPEENLQNKAARYYFRDTIRLGKGEIFVSPLDLNIDHGRIEQPLKPIIRFGTPVFDRRGNKRGVLLLNYFGAELLHVFR